MRFGGRLSVGHEGRLGHRAGCVIQIDQVMDEGHLDFAPAIMEVKILAGIHDLNK